MDQTLHLFGRRRRHADKGKKKSLFWNSEVYRDTKEMEKRQDEWAKARRAHLEAPDDKDKKTAMETAKDKLQAQQDMIEKLENDPLKKMKPKELVKLTKDNVKNLDDDAIEKLLDDYHDNEKVLELHASHLKLDVIWDSELDSEILMRVIKKISSSMEKMHKTYKQDDDYKDAMIDYLIKELSKESQKLAAVNEEVLKKMREENNTLRTKNSENMRRRDEKEDVWAARLIANEAKTEEEQREKMKKMYEEEKNGQANTRNGDNLYTDGRSLFAKLHYNNRTQYKL